MQENDIRIIARLADENKYRYCVEQDRRRSDERQEFHLFNPLIEPNGEKYLGEAGQESGQKQYFVFVHERNDRDSQEQHGERKAKQDEFDQQYGRDDRVERLGIVPVDRYVFYGGNIQPEIDENAEIRDDRLCEYGQSVVTRSDRFQYIRQRDKRHCHPDDLDDGEVSRIFDNGFVILYFLEDHFECCVKPKI